MSIKKNTCIEEIRDISIHPILNTIIADKEMNKCLVLPQYDNNVLTIVKNTK